MRIFFFSLQTLYNRESSSQSAYPVKYARVMDPKTSEWETEYTSVVCRLWQQEMFPLNSYFFVQISYKGALTGRSLRSIDTIVRLHATVCVTKRRSLPRGRGTDRGFTGWNCCFIFQKSEFKFQPEDDIFGSLSYISSVPHTSAMIIPQSRPRQLNIFPVHHTRSSAIRHMKLIKHCKIKHR